MHAFDAGTITVKSYTWKRCKPNVKLTGIAQCTFCCPVVWSQRGKLYQIKIRCRLKTWQWYRGKVVIWISPHPDVCINGWNVSQTTLPFSARVSQSNSRRLAWFDLAKDGAYPWDVGLKVRDADQTRTVGLRNAFFLWFYLAQGETRCRFFVICSCRRWSGFCFVSMHTVRPAGQPLGVQPIGVQPIAVAWRQRRMCF